MAPILAKLKALFNSSSSSSSKATPAPSAPAPGPITTTESPSTPMKPTPTTTVTPPTPSTESPAPVLAPVAAPAAVEAPAFTAEQAVVVFVLGGPGAGKGTQCARLVSELGFVHLSAGDLLRAEQLRPDSSYGAMIKEYIKEGKIVPMEVTIKLLENAMRDSMKERATTPSLFLVDGFPRQMDQAIEFDRTVRPGSLVLFLTCPEEVLLERLMERGKTSGRDDDNAESIKKRFQTFIKTSMPVVEYYRAMDKVVDIDSSQTIDEVYAVISKALVPVLPKSGGVVA